MGKDTARRADRQETLDKFDKNIITNVSLCNKRQKS